VLFSEGEDVFGGSLLTVFELDEGFGPLAPFLVGRGHDRHGGDGRVPADRRLDLDGGDVLTAGDDDVLT